MLSNKQFRLIAGALIALLAALEISTMLGESQTWDEGIHIAAGYSYLVTGDYALCPEQPALAKLLCAIPLLALNLKFDPEWLKMDQVVAGYNFLYSNRVSPDLILGVSRSVTIALTLLFAAWIALWTRRHFGPAAALIALALFCFDPNIIAHGHYITTDLPASFFIFLASTLWIDYLLAPAGFRLAIAGLALGAAISSKFSALFLVPLVIGSGLMKKRFNATAITLVLAAGVVAVAYGPEVMRLDDVGPLLPHLTRQGFAGKLFYSLAKIFNLPASSYLIGLDQLIQHNSIGHKAYLMGRFSEHGWWWYFPVAIAVKTPVGTLAAFAVAAVLIWSLREKRFIIGALALAAAVFFGFCLTSHINIGLRHVLPLYAFLFVLAGLVLARHRWLGVALTVVVAIESLSNYPHYLAFFNRAAGGPVNGPNILLDSNIDWSQDVKKLGHYLADHNIPLVCWDFFGNSDWRRFGVNTVKFPKRHEDCDGFAAVSVTPLYGLYSTPEEWAPIRQLTPVARVGYSIYVYDLRKKK